MDTHSLTSQGSKVTLTNWVRLSNAPLLLPRASAVQWNDYVFVLASDDTALLYHNKHNIWSMLPKSPYSYLSPTQAMTLHNGKILTMSANGEVSTFNPQLCRWTVLDDMRMEVGNRPRLLVSSNNILYSVVDFKTQMKQTTHRGRGQQEPAPPKHTECTVFSYDPISKWKKINEIGSSPLKSAAVVGGTLFVHAGEDMFKLTLPVEPKVAANPKLESNTILPSAQTTTELNYGMQALATINTPPTTTRLNLGVQLTGINTISPQKMPRNQPALQRLRRFVRACASPRYAGSTLHAIKDTLFSFGGRDKDNQPTSDVLRYNPDTDTWESAGYMRSCRYNVTVVTVQDTTMDVIVLGGSLGSSEHIMTQQVHPQHGLVLNDGGFSPIRSWDNKTSIVEKCTVN